jgi:hypothetical protein
MASVKSINEPNAPTTPGVLGGSINEPFKIPEGADAPSIDSIEPTEATIGDPSFTLFITGSGFIPQSVINFAGQDEPTTLNEDGTLSTGINMDVWHGPDTLPVVVKNGPFTSNAVNFTFEAAAEADAEMADPDDLEDEIEAAEEEGDFKSMHRGKPSKTLPHKRRK